MFSKRNLVMVGLYSGVFIACIPLRRPTTGIPDWGLAIARNIPTFHCEKRLCVGGFIQVTAFIQT